MSTFTFSRNYNYSCLPFPLPGEDYDKDSSHLLLNSPSASSSKNVPKLQGKVYKSAVNGHLSVASILSNAFALPGFPRSSYAISQGGKLKLTFSQIDIISKRVALMISSLAVLPGSEYHVSANNDGDSVVLIILNDEDYVDDQWIVLIFAILRLGATYMVINRHELTADGNYWKELISLIEPILVITQCDPRDMATDVKNELNIITRDQFEDFQEEQDLPSKAQGDSDDSDSLAKGSNPFQPSTTLVKKLRSSLILQPSTFLKAPTVSLKVLWDMAIELHVQNESTMQLLHFRSEVKMGLRTAFIFKCICKSPFPTLAEQWCRLGHKAIRNRISWERIEFPIKANEKLCLTFPLSDPRSLVQMFNCFIHGKQLVLGEQGEFQNAAFLFRKVGSELFKNVQRIELTPERLEELLDRVTQPKQEYLLSQFCHIKYWIIASSSESPLSPALAKQFFQKVRSKTVMLVVTYGTPECLWCATWNMFSSITEINKYSILEKDGEAKLFAGLPTINSSIVLVNDKKSVLSAVGQRGEICVMGSMIPTDGYSGAPILGRNITVFQTGDFGKLMQDKSGELQLIVETPQLDGTNLNRKIAIQGKFVDLDELSNQVKQNSTHVREAFAFICQRGKDSPEIVVAVVLKDLAKFQTVREFISTKLNSSAPSLVLTSFPVQGSIIPRITAEDTSGYEGNKRDPVDLKALRAAYFKYLGKCHPNDWLALIPARAAGSPRNATEESIEKTIQIVCKAVAFSLGTNLPVVIDNFEKSFWDLGGSPIRAILTVKSCLCQGKILSVEDFMMVDKISELGFRLVYAERNETKWFHELEIVRQFFMYSPLTRSDHMEIQDMLSANFSKLLPMTEQKKLDAFSSSLIEMFDNALSCVALSAETRELLGISLNYRGTLKPLAVPPKLEEGLELYKTLLQSCIHLTKGIQSKNLAKCYMISLKIDALVHPSQLLLVLRDLIRESMGYAENVGCRGFLICTQDPLVQEICCSLLGFETLTEIQMNLYRNKKFQKPFAHLDDNQLIGVYFSKLG